MSLPPDPENPPTRAAAAAAAADVEVRRLGDDGGVALVTLDRPHVLNAVRTATIAQLGAAFAALGADDTCRALVITGRGRAFCAGQDLVELDELAAEPDVDRRALLDGFQAVTTSLLGLRVPTIAAINGAAVGFGAELALNCDVRLGSPTARIGFVEAARAVFPTNGITWLLPRIVGHGRAAELLLGGELLDATRAVEVGLINRLVDGDVVDAAVALASAIAANAPASIRGIKAALARTWTSTLDEMCEVEIEGMLACYDTEDLAESTKAFAEKRPPRYTGR